MRKAAILTVFVLAILTAQAGSDKACSDKGSSCCCSEQHTSTTKQTKARADASKVAKAAPATAKSSSDHSVKQPLQSPKALANAR
jgi:hypothetical protein